MTARHGRVKMGERPEFEILRCASRVVLTAEQATRLASLLRHDLDWGFLIDRARIHGVTPLLAWQLQTIGQQSAPASVLAQLRGELQSNAIRNLLDRQNDAVKQSVARRHLDLGLRQFSRKDLEAARTAGETLHIQVLGLAIIAPDVTPDLARATIASIQVLGALQASPGVRAALSDRIH